MKNQVFKNQDGMVLVTAMMFMAILFLLGTAAYLIASIDLQIGGNARAAKHAFYDAEAGVQYAIARMQTGLEAGTFSLPSAVNGVEPLPITAAPSGYNFAYEGDEITRLARNVYEMTVYGGGARNSGAKLVVTFKRASKIEFAAFGDVSFDGVNAAAVYSYDHRDAPDNQPGDPDFESTGQADIGTNGDLLLHNKIYIDGDVALGADESENPAEVVDQGATVSGALGEEIGRVDPDPFDVLEPGYDALFASAKADHDNGTLVVDGGATVSLTAGTYYFDEIYIKNGVLNIDAAFGPVDIYVQGPVTIDTDHTLNIINDYGNDVTFRLTDPPGGLSSPDILIAKNGSHVNMTGQPTEFTIFSDSAAGIRFHNASELKGVFYAPLGEIEMDNGTGVYGSVWGEEIFIKNSVDLYFDTALLDEYPTNKLPLLSWLDDRND